MREIARDRYVLFVLGRFMVVQFYDGSKAFSKRHFLIDLDKSIGIDSEIRFI